MCIDTGHKAQQHDNNKKKRFYLIRIAEFITQKHSCDGKALFVLRCGYLSVISGEKQS